jgi:pyrroloquinoline quinone biosynthesis protein B
VAYEFLDHQTGGRLLVAPDVGAVNKGLKEALQNADAVLFDGTFWSNDELRLVNPGARTSADMGHVTIRETSLALLGGIGARHKIYIHINNTNPVLAADSPERAAVEAAGLVVGYDGLEFQL